MFIAVLLFIIAPNWNRSNAHQQEKGQIEFGVPVSAILLSNRTLCRAAQTHPRPPRNAGLISPSAGAAPGRQPLAVSPFGRGGGRFFLAETNSLTQSTILFLEKQPTSNAGLTGE